MWANIVRNSSRVARALGFCLDQNTLCIHHLLIRYLSTINNFCNILIRTGMELVAFTVAIKSHEFSLILSSIKKENQ